MGIEHQNTSQNRGLHSLGEVVAEVGASYEVDLDLVRVKHALDGARQHVHGALQYQLLAYEADRASRADITRQRQPVDRTVPSLEAANANLDTAREGLMILTRAYLGMQQQ